MGGGKGGSTEVHYQPNPATEKIVAIFDRFIAPRLNVWGSITPSPDTIQQGNVDYYKGLDALYSKTLNDFMPSTLEADKNIINKTFSSQQEELGRVIAEADKLPSQVKNTYTEAISNASQIFNSINNKNMLGLAATGFLNTPLAQKQAADAFNTVVNPILRDQASAVSGALSSRLNAIGATADKSIANLNTRASGLLNVNQSLRNLAASRIDAYKDVYNAWLNAQMFPDTMMKSYLGILTGAGAGYTPIVEQNPSTTSRLAGAAGNAAATYALASVAGLNPAATAALTAASAISGGKR